MAVKYKLSKCKSVRFGLVDRSGCNYYIYGLPLQKVIFTKDLGAVYGYILTFSEQCHKVAKESFARVYTLSRCFHLRDRNIQIKLFNSFVRPILEYASIRLVSSSNL